MSGDMIVSYDDRQYLTIATGMAIALISTLVTYYL